MRLTPIRLVVTLALVLGTAPFPAETQPPAKVPRIGILTPAAGASTPLWEAFRQGLRDLGYVEGKNIALEYRFAAGQNERLPELAAELVHRKVDLIVTNSGAAAQAARDATETIPIVMAAGGDPVRLGVVASLAQPGGNLTGLSIMTQELDGKRLELLKEALPHVSHVAVLWNASNPARPDAFREIEATARVLGLQLHSRAVRHPDELDSAFSAMTSEGAEALIALGDAVLWNYRTRIVALAVQHHLPAMFDAREFVDAGGLMAYGPHVPDMYRRAATYVAKILKGAKPAELPVEQPTKFELVINLKTAQALGITFPPTLLMLADEAIR